MWSCLRVLSNFHIETEAGEWLWGLQVRRRWKCAGMQGEGEARTHFSCITVFPRINLAYIWKSYTCLKCYSKESFVTLKYFMWELGKKDNTVWKSHWIQSRCEKESMHFSLRSHAAFSLFYFIFACLISLFQCVPFILTLYLLLFFPFPFFSPENLSYYFLHTFSILTRAVWYINPGK